MTQDFSSFNEFRRVLREPSIGYFEPDLQRVDTGHGIGLDAVSVTGHEERKS